MMTLMCKSHAKKGELRFQNLPGRIIIATDGNSNLFKFCSTNPTITIQIKQKNSKKQKSKKKKQLYDF